MALELLKSQMAELLNEAEQYQDVSSLFKARTLLESAAEQCPCKSGRPSKKECRCIDLLQAIQQGTLRGKLARTRCQCGRRPRICTNSLHMNALDGIASITIKARQFGRTSCTAKMMVLMNPRNAKGYIRLGQALRYGKRLELAKSLYQQAIQILTEKESFNPQHAKDVQFIRDQVKRLDKVMFKTDPLERFPKEVARHVLGYLDLRQLSRCIQVSKGWRDYITRDHLFWTTVDFGSAPVRRLTHKVLGKMMVQYAQGNVTSIASDGGLHQQPTKLGAMLELCPKLKHLTLNLGTPAGTTGLPLHVWRARWWPKLETLFLGSACRISPSWLQRLLEESADTMKEISVLEFPNMDPSLGESFEMPYLPRLTTLRIANLSQQRIRIDLPSIRRQTPNVEHLWFGRNVTAFTRRNKPITLDDLASSWLCIKTLYVDNTVIFKGRMAAASLPNVTGQLTEVVVGVHMLLDIANDSSSVLQAGSWRQTPECKALHQLRKFTALSLSIEDPRIFIQDFLKPSLLSGSLEELEMTPIPFLADDFKSDNALAWFKGKSVKYLCLTGFSILQQDGLDIDEVFLNTVDRFPAIRVLDIRNEPISIVTLYKVITRYPVMAIYHLHGAAMEDLREFAHPYDCAVIPGKYPDCPSNFPHRRRVPPPSRADDAS